MKIFLPVLGRATKAVDNACRAINKTISEQGGYSGFRKSAVFILALLLLSCVSYAQNHSEHFDGFRYYEGVFDLEKGLSKLKEVIPGESPQINFVSYLDTCLISGQVLTPKPELPCIQMGDLLVAGGKGAMIQGEITVSEPGMICEVWIAAAQADPFHEHPYNPRLQLTIELVDKDGNVTPMECGFLDEPSASKSKAGWWQSSTQAHGLVLKGKKVKPAKKDRDTSSFIYILDWTKRSFTVPPGQTVRMTCTSTDCGLFGHSSTAWLTYEVSKIEVERRGDLDCFKPNSVQLQAPQADEYAWNTGDSTQVLDVMTPGRYWVEFTTPSGCIAYAETTLDPPTGSSTDLEIEVSGVISCRNESPVILRLPPELHPDVQINWSTGETADSIIVFDPGRYSAVLTRGDDCRAILHADVKADFVFPDHHFSLSETAICSGETVDVEFEPISRKYLSQVIEEWDFNGAEVKNNTISFPSPGTYTISRTILRKPCKVEDLQTITVYPEPSSEIAFSVHCGAEELFLIEAVDDEIDSLSARFFTLDGSLVIESSSLSDSLSFERGQEFSYNSTVWTALGCTSSSSDTLYVPFNSIPKISKPEKIETSCLNPSFSLVDSSLYFVDRIYDQSGIGISWNEEGEGRWVVGTLGIHEITTTMTNGALSCPQNLTHRVTVLPSVKKDFHVNFSPDDVFEVSSSE